MNCPIFSFRWNQFFAAFPVLFFFGASFLPFGADFVPPDFLEDFALSRRFSLPSGLRGDLFALGLRLLHLLGGFPGLLLALLYLALLAPVPGSGFVAVLRTLGIALRKFHTLGRFMIPGRTPAFGCLGDFLTGCLLVPGTRRRSLPGGSFRLSRLVDLGQFLTMPGLGRNLLVLAVRTGQLLVLGRLGVLLAVLCIFHMAGRLLMPSALICVLRLAMFGFAGEFVP